MNEQLLFDAETKVGDLVTLLPASSSLMKQFKIDFCCGGNRPVGEVLQERQIEPALFFDELKVVLEKQANRQESGLQFSAMRSSTLIDYIIDVHHAYLRNVLPELYAFTQKVGLVHGPRHPELYEVAGEFKRLKDELEEHLKHEEELTFPLIKKYETNATEQNLAAVVNTIDALENEHESAGDILKHIRNITNDYALPSDACKTYQLTFMKLEELENDLFQHIHLENNILFPRFQH